MNSEDISKGTYTNIPLGPSFFLLVYCIPFFILSQILSSVYRSGIYWLLGLLSPILIWILDRFILQREISCRITEKHTQYEGNYHIIYLITPEGWSQSLEVNEFTYSIITTANDTIIARYGLLSKQVSRITIL